MLAQALRQVPSPPCNTIDVVDPASAAFRALQGGLQLDEPRPRPCNPHVGAVIEPVCAWAARHGLASAPRVAATLARARFDVLAGYGHPGADYEGFLLTTKWCTWLFFQDDLLCDRHGDAGGILGPAALAAAHRDLLAALAGEAPRPGDALASSIHDIGRQIVRWRGPAALDRFVGTVRDYLWGNEWEALNRIRGEVPSVSAFSKMRPHAGAAYTAFEFWAIVEDFPGGARLDHVAARELRLLANNCISWANDLYSLRKEIDEGNPNNVVLAIAREDGCDLPAAMRATVALYNREYRAFMQLVADLPTLGLGRGELDLRPYADRLHGWILGNIHWSRMTPRYREGLTMIARRDADADVRGSGAAAVPCGRQSGLEAPRG